ncbi:hypothetical protein [Aquibium microcysteis]|uniref:hypothetical protein n=1 Tax=Aquibium microcysteis TaxID=675281 RepID=UPI00165CF899|nr:hypothetical protein [Aquibium microcysteis]
MTLAAGAAFAQECACVVTSTANIIGRVTAVKGTVRISQQAGFSPVQNQSALQKGATIMTGGDGSTTLELGTGCTINLVENQSMTLVSQANGNICAAVRTEAAAAGGVTTGAVVGVGVGTALLVGGVIVLSQDKETISVSQQ